MSRVSDAFRRAVEERGAEGVQEAARQWLALTPEHGDFGQTVISQPPASVENNAGREQRSKSQKQLDSVNNANPSKPLNGQSRPTVSDEPGSILKGLTLRQWMEQVLFGRGLRAIAPYPLIALEKNSHAGEQYKILREQINQIFAEGRLQFIAVTSPIKGDGKTTVAANLAAAMALHREQQVLLIDADLRSPSIHRYFGLNSSPGLAEFLSSPAEGELMDYIQDTSIPGLRLLTAGKATSHSAELLASERMKALIDEIGAKFASDQVIVDTPPVLSTSDPLVLSRQLDGLLIVVRAGKTPRECLSEATKLLGPNKIIGLVLNGADLGRSAKYYYYYGQTS